MSKLVNILAPGISMSQALADSLKDQNCIVLSNCYQLAPWALALCAQDHAWWNFHREARDFAGEKFSANKIRGVQQIQSDYVQRQSSSGVLGLEVARRFCLKFGWKEIHLHGYDNRGTHYFGPHPAPLKNTSPSRFSIFASQLQALGDEMKKGGFRIINMTPDSALECFERG